MINTSVVYDIEPFPGSNQPQGRERRPRYNAVELPSDGWWARAVRVKWITLELFRRLRRSNFKRWERSSWTLVKFLLQLNVITVSLPKHRHGCHSETYEQRTKVYAREVKCLTVSQRGIRRTRTTGMRSPNSSSKHSRTSASHSPYLGIQQTRYFYCKPGFSSTELPRVCCKKTKEYTIVARADPQKLTWLCTKKVKTGQTS